MSTTEDNHTPTLRTRLLCPIQAMWHLTSLFVSLVAALIMFFCALASLLCAFIVRGLHVLQSTRCFNLCLLQPVWAALQWIPALAGLILHSVAILFGGLTQLSAPGKARETLLHPSFNLYHAAYKGFSSYGARYILATYWKRQQHIQVLLTGFAALPVSLTGLAACCQPSQDNATTLYDHLRAEPPEQLGGYLLLGGAF